MADLDAELLALAGGDDSSGEESMPSLPRKKSPSPLPDTARKGVAKATKKAKRRRNYSDEDDDVSSPSQHSDSASMSQSESEAEFAPGEEKPIFPYEKLYYDASDKARIQAAPEIDREEILAQRSEQVERHEQDLTLRRLVATRAKEEAKNAAKGKRKASAADLEESQRKSSRQRTKLGGGRAGEASTAIEAYKLQRAEKNIRDEQRKKNAANRAVSPRNDYSDVDAEGESDDGYDDRRYNKRRSPTPPKDDPTAELSDIQRARIGRDNFAQVCYTPGFEEAIIGCYARVCLGPGRTPGVNEYRLCSIKGFKTGRPYAMTGANNRQFLVDQYIVAAHGKAERPWSFIECSMSKFTDDEWRRYRLTMANEDCKMPTRGVIAKKLEQINKLLTHRFTDTEISERLKKQNVLMDHVNRTQEKDELRAQISAALQAGDDEIAAELEEKLANLVAVKLALNTTIGKTDSYVNREQERLAELNRRNQRLNAENVRKAQLLEIRARKSKKHLAPGVDELFEGGSDISRAGTPVNGTPRAGTPNPLTPSNGAPRSTLAVPKKKSGLPGIRKAALDDEILASMDLGIDIDI